MRTTNERQKKAHRGYWPGPRNGFPRNAGIFASCVPTTKEDIEKYVAGPFVQAAAHHNFFPFTVAGAPEQNTTDDFDFTLRTSEGMKYLELMEVHLRDLVVARQTPGPSAYNVYDAACQVLKGIQAKSSRYRGATDRGIVLLTYVTHWQFSLDIPVLLLLSYWLLSNPPAFERVFYMSFLETQNRLAFAAVSHS